MILTVRCVDEVWPAVPLKCEHRVRAVLAFSRGHTLCIYICIHHDIHHVRPLVRGLFLERPPGGSTHAGTSGIG